MSEQMPQNVVWYENISYVAIALSAASIPLRWPTLEKYFHKYPVGYPIEIAVALLVQVLWVWFVARKRANWARWVTLVWSATAVVYPLFHYQREFDLGVVFAIVYYAINLMFLIAAGLLFLPNAVSWYAQRGAESIS